jgi:hypothetical protein
VAVAVAFGRPSVDADIMRFQGIDLFNLPAREVVGRLRERMAIEPAEDDPATFVAPDLLFSL